jgi:hypothetical protein
MTDVKAVKLFHQWRTTFKLAGMTDAIPLFDACAKANDNDIRQ